MERALRDEAGAAIGGVEPIAFEPSSCPAFRAEVGTDGVDFVFHFYPPEGMTRAAYWLEDFPAALDVVARSFFRALPPTLRAAYTPELGSWWMRADGFARPLAPALPQVRELYRRLEEALRTRSTT